MREQNLDKQLLIDFLLPSVEYLINDLKKQTKNDIEGIKERIDFELTREGRLSVLQNEFDNLKNKWPNLSFYVKRRLDESFVADYMVDKYYKLVQQNFNQYKNIAQPLLSDNLILEELWLLSDFHREKFNGFFGDALIEIQLISLVDEYDFIKDQYHTIDKDDYFNVTRDEIEPTTKDLKNLTDSSKDNNKDWMDSFFLTENNILPRKDHFEYKDFLKSSIKQTIDIKKEPWRVFAVLMVWAENGKLDLREYDNKHKSKPLNIKVAHFMAKYFTDKGKIRSNDYYNSNTFVSLNTKSGHIQRKFNQQLCMLCGNLKFKLPQGLQILTEIDRKSLKI